MKRSASDLDVIYADNHLVAVNKPAGLLTQPNETEALSLEELTKEWVRVQYDKQGNVFLEAIHRLDRPVSGVVVFAKTSKALSRLTKAVREREVKKRYVALVEGSVQPKQRRLINQIEKQGQKGAIVGQGGQEAVLSYTVLEEKNGTSLLQIELETGRYHQIRVQLAHIGHPIVGDTKYGSKTPFKEGIALHHAQFEIPHPTTHERLVLCASRRW